MQPGHVSQSVSTKSLYGGAFLSTHMTNHRLTAAGFTVLYCALMGGLLLLTIPHVEGIRDKLGLLLLPPCIVFGAALMMYGRLRADPGAT